MSVQIPTKRFFRRYILEVLPQKKKNNAPSLPLFAEDKSFSLYELIKSRIGDPNTFLIKKSNLRIRLRNIKQENNYLILFFVCENLNHSPIIVAKEEGQGFSDRTLETEKEENIVNSIHLLIGLDKEKRTLAILEEVNGVAMGDLISIINNILKESPLSYRTERNKEDKAYYSVNFQGFLSKSFINSLEKGRLSGVTFIKPPDQNVFMDIDTHDCLKPKEYQLKIEIAKATHDAPYVWGQIQTLFKKLSKEQGYEKVKFQLSLEGRNKTIAIEREEEAKEKLFVFSKEVTFDEELQPYTSDICDIIVQKERELLESLEL